MCFIVVRDVPKPSVNRNAHFNRRSDGGFGLRHDIEGFPSSLFVSEWR
jgi:hypothetical protein